MISQNKYNNPIAKKSQRCKTLPDTSHQTEKSFTRSSIVLSNTFLQSSDHYLTRPLQKLQKKLQKYKNLNHPYLQQITHFQIQNSNHQVTLHFDHEMHDSTSLKEFTQEGNHNHLNKLKQIMIQIASALEYLHSQHILHDSINPDSVKKYKNRYKLGFNQFKQTKKYIEQANDSIVQPSDYYLSPQKYYNNGYNQSSDIWSLGILFLQMAIGSPISAISSILPCQTDTFNLERITNRLTDFSFKKMIHLMLKPNPADRISLTLVKYYISKINFQRVNLQKMDKADSVANTSQMQINLFKMVDRKREQKSKIQLDNYYQNCVQLGNSAFKALFLLNQFQGQTLLTILLTRRSKIHFTLQTTLRFEQLSRQIQHCFRNLPQLFNFLQNGQVVSFQSTPSGTLKLSFDRQICHMLKQINSIPSGSAIKNSVPNQQFENSLSNNRLQSNNCIDQFGSQEYQNQFQSPYHQASGYSSWQQKFDGRNKISIQDNTNFSYETYQAESHYYYLRGQFLQALKLQEQATQLKLSIFSEESIQLLGNYYRLGNRYIKLLEYESAFKYFKKAGYFKTNKPQFKLIQLQCIIFLFFILEYTNKLQQFQKELNVVRKMYPMEWRILQIQGYVLCIKWYFQNKNYQAIESVFPKIICNIDLSQNVTNDPQATLYYEIFKLVQKTSIVQYYDFTYQLLGKAVLFFKQFMQIPELCSEINQVIQNFRRILSYQNMEISQQKIRQFVPKYMPEYYSHIFQNPLPPSYGKKTLCFVINR